MSLPPPFDNLLEHLSERTHENWAAARKRQGWRHGSQRDDERKEHPSLVPYADLSDEEKAIDRVVAGGILQALVDMGYRITREGVDTFREYEFIADGTQFLTERRQSSAHIYLTMNTAIFAIFGLLIKEASLRGWDLFWSSLPLIVVGLSACLVWQAALRHYKALIAWRYEQLMAIEQSEAMAGSHRIYTREWENYMRPRHKDRGFPFSKLEIALPWLFIGLYGCYLGGLIIMLAKY